MPPHPVADREQGRPDSGPTGMAAASEGLWGGVFVRAGVSDGDGSTWVGLTLASSDWLASTWQSESRTPLVRQC